MQNTVEEVADLAGDLAGLQLGYKSAASEHI